MSVSELELQIGTATMRCTPDEVAETLAALLDEMRGVIPFLRPDEREVLRHIMARESGSLFVRDVFPLFTRDSEGHKTLRRFRAAQFVRPAESGRWLLDERIAVKPFARLVWDRLGEDEIFSPGAASSPAEPAPVEGAESPEAAEAPAAETAPEPAAVDVEQLAAALWEDNDVLDLRDVRSA